MWPCFALNCPTAPLHTHTHTHTPIPTSICTHPCKAHTHGQEECRELSDDVGRCPLNSHFPALLPLYGDTRQPSPSRHGTTPAASCKRTRARQSPVLRHQDGKDPEYQQNGDAEAQEGGGLAWPAGLSLGREGDPAPVTPLAGCLISRTWQVTKRSLCSLPAGPSANRWVLGTSPGASPGPGSGAA